MLCLKGTEENLENNGQGNCFVEAIMLICTSNDLEVYFHVSIDFVRIIATL